MTKSASRQGVPQISFSHFLLTGHLVTNTRASRALALVEEAKLAARARRMVNNKELRQIEDVVAMSVPEMTKSQSNKKVKSTAKKEKSTHNIFEIEEMVEGQPGEQEGAKDHREQNSRIKETKEEESPKDAFDMTEELFPFMAFEEAEADDKPKPIPVIIAEEPMPKVEKKHKISGKSGKHTATFTKEQDDLIVKMKGVGSPLSDICASVKASKKQIQERYKELSAAGTPNVATKSGETPVLVKEKNESIAIPEDLNAASTSDGPTQKFERVPVAIQNQLVHNIAMEDQPPISQLAADDSWTAQDCEILEMLEKRYREQKWLHMQSQFYNYTGRMVPAELIMWKFGVQK